MRDWRPTRASCPAVSARRTTTARSSSIARAAGLELVVDEALEQEIESISRAVAERLRRPYADFEAGVTKQATRPAPAVSIGLAGTAPGPRLPGAERAASSSSCPDRRAELQRLWPNALASEPVRELLARTPPPGRRVLRLFGVSESAVARALDEAGGDGDGRRGDDLRARVRDPRRPRRRAGRGGARGRSRRRARGARSRSGSSPATSAGRGARPLARAARAA